MDLKMHEFTKEDIDKHWPYFQDYLVEILNLQYSVEEAREDLFSLIEAQPNGRGKR